MPQIIMLNHASRVNGARMDQRMERKRKAEERKRERDEKDPIGMGGKRVSEMNSEEMFKYLSGEESVNVIVHSETSGPVREATEQPDSQAG